MVKKKLYKALKKNMYYFLWKFVASEKIKKKLHKIFKDIYDEWYKFAIKYRDLDKP